MVDISWIDYFIFIMMLVISLCTGVYVGLFGKIKMTPNHYLMGGKTMKSFPIATSLVAGHMSTVTLLAMPVETYQYGGNLLWTVLSASVACVILMYVYLPVLYSLQLTSIYEYLERRFDKKTRLLASFLYVLQYLFFLSMIMYISGLACYTVSGFNLHLVVVTVCVVCIIYTSIGGLKSVVWVDVFQMGILVITVPTFLVLGVIKRGGPTVVWSKVVNGRRFDIFDFDPNPTKRDSFWIVFIGSVAQWLASCGINQCSILKYTSVPTFNDCKKAAVYFTIGAGLFTAINLIQGLNIYAFYSDCDPVAATRLDKYDGLVSYYIMDMAKNATGVCGLFMACIFSASLSSLSTTLNSLSGVIYKDFVSKLLAKNFSEKQECNILKMIVLTSGTICILLIFVIERLGGLFQVAYSILSLANGPQLGMFTLGVVVPRANPNGAFYGGLCGLISGMSLMVGAQYYRSQNWLPNLVKPLSTEGCTFNQTDFAPRTIANTTDTTFEANFIFRISFYYYCFITTAVTIILGIIFSYVTKQNLQSVDRKLINPLCHSLLPNTSDDPAEAQLCNFENN